MGANGLPDRLSGLLPRKLGGTGTDRGSSSASGQSFRRQSGNDLQMALPADGAKIAVERRGLLPVLERRSGVGSRRVRRRWAYTSISSRQQPHSPNTVPTSDFHIHDRRITRSNVFLLAATVAFAAMAGILKCDVHADGTVHQMPIND